MTILMFLPQVFDTGKFYSVLSAVPIAFKKRSRLRKGQNGAKGAPCMDFMHKWRLGARVGVFVAVVSSQPL